MKKMTIREIIKATEAQLITAGDLEQVLNTEIQAITQDSRTADGGSLYVAIIGERLDGHQFIPECMNKGVAACLSEQVVSPKTTSALLYVPSVKKALLQLAAYYKSQFSIPVVGITGSVGKTTTKDMVASVVKQKYDTLWTEGNYNNDIGVPLTLFRLEEHHEVAIIEMGMNHFDELHALAEVVRPNIGLISNVGVAHLEFLGSREGILQAKCELFDFMDETGVAILNADNDMLIGLDGKMPQRQVWFGLENHKGIFASDLSIEGLERTCCKVHTPIGEMELSIPLPGEHMVLNALSAVAVGLELGIGLEDIKRGIESFVPTKNRMNIIKQENGVTIIDDVYNANPISMKASLDILATAKGRKIAILGYMGELGEIAAEMHQEIGEYAAKKGIDMLLCIGHFSQKTEHGARQAGLRDAYTFETQEDVWEEGFDWIQAGDTILVKGSRSLQLEKTVEKIQGVN